MYIVNSYTLAIIFCFITMIGEHRGGSPALGRENTAHARHTCADSQGGTQAEEKGGAGEETLPQEADRHREAVRR